MLEGKLNIIKRIPTSDNSVICIINLFNRDVFRIGEFSIDQHKEVIDNFVESLKTHHANVARFNFIES